MESITMDLLLGFFWNTISDLSQYYIRTTLKAWPYIYRELHYGSTIGIVMKWYLRQISKLYQNIHISDPPLSEQFQNNFKTTLETYLKCSEILTNIISEHSQNDHSTALKPSPDMNTCSRIDMTHPRTISEHSQNNHSTTLKPSPYVHM